MFEDSIQNFSILYIISQIFALATFILDLVAIQQRKKTSLLNLGTVAAFCALLHYAFLGAWSGMAIKIITTMRNAVAAYESAHNRKSSKVLPMIFVVLFIVASCFTFESVFSLLPMLAATIYTFTIYLSDIKKIRYVSILTNAIWLVYNICVFSLVGIVAQAILALNSIIAVYRYRKKPHRKKR